MEDLEDSSSDHTITGEEVQSRSIEVDIGEREHSEVLHNTSEVSTSKIDFGVPVGEEWYTKYDVNPQDYRVSELDPSLKGNTWEKLRLRKDGVVLFTSQLESGLRLPIDPFISLFLSKTRLAVTDIHPNAIRILTSFIVICRARLEEPTIPVLRELFDFIVRNGIASFRFRPYKVLTPLDNKIHSWLASPLLVISRKGWTHRPAYVKDKITPRFEGERQPSLEGVDASLFREIVSLLGGEDSPSAFSWRRILEDSVLLRQTGILRRAVEGVESLVEIKWPKTYHGWEVHSGCCFPDKCEVCSGDVHCRVVEMMSVFHKKTTMEEKLKSFETADRGAERIAVERRKALQQLRRKLTLPIAASGRESDDLPSAERGKTGKRRAREAVSKDGSGTGDMGEKGVGRRGSGHSKVVRGVKVEMDNVGAAVEADSLVLSLPALKRSRVDESISFTEENNATVKMEPIDDIQGMGGSGGITDHVVELELPRSDFPVGSSFAASWCAPYFRFPTDATGMERLATELGTVPEMRNFELGVRDPVKSAFGKSVMKRVTDFGVASDLEKEDPEDVFSYMGQSVCKLVTEAHTLLASWRKSKSMAADLERVTKEKDDLGLRVLRESNEKERQLLRLEKKKGELQKAENELQRVKEQVGKLEKDVEKIPGLEADLKERDERIATLLRENAELVGGLAKLSSENVDLKGKVSDLSEKMTGIGNTAVEEYKSSVQFIFDAETRMSHLTERGIRRPLRAAAGEGKVAIADLARWGAEPLFSVIARAGHKYVPYSVDELSDLAEDDDYNLRPVWSVPDVVLPSIDEMMGELALAHQQTVAREAVVTREERKGRGLSYFDENGDEIEAFVGDVGDDAFGSIEGSKEHRDDEVQGGEDRAK